MRFLAIIPSRYASTRFPGKPLQLINGKPMLQHVFERVKESGLFERAVVATDDMRIEKAVENFGGDVIMTSLHHQSGTGRCAEAAEKIGGNFEVIINVQGDEPFIEHTQLKMLCRCFLDNTVKIATLIKKIEKQEELFDSNVVKCVTDISGKALYFSRSPIPFLRDKPQKEWVYSTDYFKHIGIYGYRIKELLHLVKLPPNRLEQAESLEQLRWLSSGFTIHTALTEIETVAIDTPEDLLKIR
ncbi:MAG: 3-deoxy-manno-octulosonate cytidylyltransferase [Chitinophagales bacterium]|nr:3-deoxy-manno-octulosonate cytidylyltransferase [Chitinophagales bacterium]